MNESKSLEGTCKFLCTCGNSDASLSAIRKIQASAEELIKSNLEPHEYGLVEGGKMNQSFQKIVRIKYATIRFSRHIKNVSIQGGINWYPSAKLFLKHAGKTRSNLESSQKADIGIANIEEYKTLMLEAEKEGYQKNNSVSMEINVIVNPKKTVNLVETLENHDFIKQLVNLLSFTNKKCRIQVCSRFNIPKEKYRLGGGLVLPRKLDFGSDQFVSIGTPSMSGIGLTFEDSPIGLYSVDIEDEPKNYTLRTSLKYKSVSTPNLLADALMHSISTADLFIEENKG